MTDKGQNDKNIRIGVITHYYSKLGVGIIKLEKELNLGDEIIIKGHSSDFKQKVEGLQFDHKDIVKGEKGQDVGVKLKEKVREGDVVYIAK